jgi:glycosyltransferase involved in cell wall biosynthesis
VDDEPIRVLRVIARLNVGGPALHVAYLSEGLDRRGFATTLVSGRVSPGEASMEYAVRERGVEPLFLRELQRDVSPLADLRGVARLRSLVRALRPHVVHTHTAKAGTVGRVAALLAGEARPPALVHTFHGHVLAGYFAGARQEVFRRIERALARRTDALVAVSPEVRDQLVELGVAAPGRVEVLRLGLDLDQRVGHEPGDRERVRQELGIAAGRPVVGWVGRMAPIKRVGLLLEATARVDCELVLVGDGPERAGLERRAAELGIAGRCRFAGFRKELGPYYACFDVLALSSANEGTPVTLIEGLAAGVPVVATDVGGVPDVVRHGVSGLLAPSGDAAALAGALAELLRDPARRAAMAAAGSADVRSRYGVERLVDDVDRLYRRLLERRPARRR